MQLRVSASHVDARWRLDNVIFSSDYTSDYQVQSSDYGDGRPWFAIAPNFGCGKSYRTPQEAIRGLLADNGCYAITITTLA